MTFTKKFLAKHKMDPTEAAKALHMSKSVIEKFSSGALKPRTIIKWGMLYWALKIKK